MGIAPYKYFTFDGESSRNYDVYLTGTGVFNAPQRAVDLLEIPGRNGNYALDQGRFNNITVTYKAGIVDYSESDFADKVSAVRNWLCSKVGYVRLTDDYNPDEYRMAVFKNGITVDHDDLKTGEFDITFECKPQRWLTSGETATAVANNGTLINPTPFEAEPLLAVKGYGTIDFNGYEVELEAITLGDIDIAFSGGTTKTLDLSNLNNGDQFSINVDRLSFEIEFSGTYGSSTSMEQTAWSDSQSGCSTVWSSYYTRGNKAYSGYKTNYTSPVNFNKGTSGTFTNTATWSGNIRYHNTNYASSVSVTETITYDGTNSITISVSGTVTSSCPATSTVLYRGLSVDFSIVGHSTVSALGNPTYIDCDIGECWMYNSSGEIVSLNGVISLGSDLPKLSSGANTFTYDNTVTELKVTPRWWKV